MWRESLLERFKERSEDWRALNEGCAAHHASYVLVLILSARSLQVNEIDNAATVAGLVGSRSTKLWSSEEVRFSLADRGDLSHLPSQDIKQLIISTYWRLNTMMETVRAHADNIQNVNWPGIAR